MAPFWQSQPPALEKKEGGKLFVLSRVDLVFAGFQANGAVDLVFFKDNFLWIAVNWGCGYVDLHFFLDREQWACLLDLSCVDLPVPILPSLEGYMGTGKSGMETDPSSL